MKTIYSIANSFAIVLESASLDAVAQQFSKEYNDFQTDDSSFVPILGNIKDNLDDLDSASMRELVKDWLYEDNKYLYVRYDNKYACINTTKDFFEVCYESGFNGKVLFHFIEVLIRMYSYKAGIDFFHASSFIYNDEVIMLNGFGGSGKTEIMINFLLHGASFLSDDLVVVSESGSIFPYRVAIPLRWSAIDEDFIIRLKLSKTIYDVCKYCKSHINPLTRRIYWKLASQHFLYDHSYREISSVNADLRFYHVDCCIWLQDSADEGSFKFSVKNYFKYMNLCLENESRKYFDIEGFLKLKFPILATFDCERVQLRRKICHSMSISGFSVKHHNYSSAAEYIRNNIVK